MSTVDKPRAPVASPEAREFLRQADPVLARLIDARPDFRPRAWIDELPPLDAFGTLIFEVAGQQLSVSSTRAIVSHLDRFGGHLPSRPKRSGRGAGQIRTVPVGASHRITDFGGRTA